MARASALPKKWFFVEMFTRDLSLSDCVLDLIDNSIDGIIRTKEINLINDFFSTESHVETNQLSKIAITIESNIFQIQDNCGGVSYDKALTDLFNFGYPADHLPQLAEGQLGVYGVGLKRAIFKMGDTFEFISKTKNDGFIVKVESLKDWIRNDNNLEDWTFPIKKLDAANKESDSGTQIVIKNLREEVVSTIENGIFLLNLRNEIAKIYSLFLNRYVTISLNGKNIEPTPMPMGKSENVVPAYKQIDIDGVSIKLFASLAGKNFKDRWTYDQAGWYIACNGRLIVIADKTDLTGWGSGALPSFHSKYRGFIGLAVFQSKDPLKLPWRTTKKGINEESIIYQQIKNEMRTISRPILTFLDKMYPSEPREDHYEREIASEVKSSNILSVSKSDETSFKIVEIKPRSPKSTVRIQFDAKISQVNAIKKHLRRPDMSGMDVGKYTFEKYIENEGI